MLKAFNVYRKNANEFSTTPKESKIMIKNYFYKPEIPSGFFLKKDSSIVKNHSPKTAALMSAVLPGLGQAYNKKYWKIPIIYAALGTGAYFIRWNFLKYDTLHTAFKLRTDDDTSTHDIFENIYATEDLFTLQDYYRHNLDLMVIVTTALYGLNIIDAIVDAHLFHFDVSDKLSFNWNVFPNGKTPSFNLSIQFH